jgi:hypothetical protein
MFFYLVIVPAIIMVVVMIFELSIINKHDKVLFQFCQLRRNMLAYVRQKGITMPEADYVLMNELLDFVGNTIHDFKYLKEEVFNVRKAKKLAITSKMAQREKHVFMSTDNKKIKVFQNQVRFCLINSILAYTPFLKYELVLRVLYAFGSLMARFSYQKSKNFLGYIQIYIDDKKWFDDPKHHYNLYKNNFC